MEQDSSKTTTNIESSKQKENKSIIIICIALIFGFIGIGFGVYGLITGSKKDEQINKLQEQINQLKNTTSQTTTEKAKIKIISSSWSGWSENHESDETESYCEIELHKKCIVKTRQISDSEGNEQKEEILSFEITAINTNSIDIHTLQVFSDNENGVDLQSNKQDFTIKLDEPLTLTTPTMDAGDIFTITLSQD